MVVAMATITISEMRLPVWRHARPRGMLPASAIAPRMRDHALLLSTAIISTFKASLVKSFSTQVVEETPTTLSGGKTVIMCARKEIKSQGIRTASADRRAILSNPEQRWWKKTLLYVCILCAIVGQLKAAEENLTRKTA